MNGSFGQYMLVDAKFAAIIPEGADPVEVAPVLCAGVIALGEMIFSEEAYGLYVVRARGRDVAHPALRFLAGSAVRNGAIIVGILLLLAVIRRLLPA